jgi:hypothetical protein
MLTRDTRAVYGCPMAMRQLIIVLNNNLLTYVNQCNTYFT